MDENEKTERARNSKKKLLTKNQRDQIAELVAQGISPSTACIAIGRPGDFLLHTKKEHPEWYKELMALVTSKVEEYLARIVKGEVSKVKKVYTAVFKDGEQVLDAKGKPVMRLVKTEKEQIIPSQGQQQLWLQAHAAETYGAKAGEAPATLGDDTDPQSLVDALKAKYLDPPKNLT